MASPHAARVRALTRWLERHHNVICNAEAEALGISARTRYRLGQQGLLVPVLPHVWVAGNVARTPELDLRIALKGAPVGSAASGWSAAWWLGLEERPPAHPEVSVDVTHRLRWELATIHRTTLAGDTRSVRELMVTTPERTLLDLAATPTMSEQRLAAAIDRGIASGLTTIERISQRAARPRVRGGPRLRAVLAWRADADVPTASVLEQRANRLLSDLHHRHGIEMPDAEVKVFGGRYRLDFAWRRLRLAVEVDGYAWHSTEEARLHDLNRRNELAAAGWAILVFTWQQVVNDPAGFCDRVLEAYRRAEAA